MKKQLEKMALKAKAVAKKAFTLIEMLIVVTIIGIIVGIAVPNLLDAKTDARDAKRDTVLAQVATAKTRYILDNSAADWNTQVTAGNEFNELQQYILVSGVQPADEAELLDGTEWNSLTYGDSDTAPVGS